MEEMKTSDVEETRRENGIVQMSRENTEFFNL
jgi:hypothetical protein